MSSQTVEINTNLPSIREKLDLIHAEPSLLLNVIKDLYKRISVPAKKQIWEKTANDIADDVASAKINISLDQFVKEKTAETINLQNSSQIVINKIKWMPLLLDLMYAYYVRHVDENAVVYECPSTVFKLHLVLRTINTLHVKKYTDINQAFEFIVCNEWFQKFRSTPPIYFDTAYNIYDLEKKIIEVCIPVLKTILSMLFRLSNENFGSTCDLFAIEKQ